MMRTKTIRLNFNLRLCFRSDVKFNFRVTIEIENLRFDLTELRFEELRFAIVTESNSTRNCDYASDHIVWSSISELIVRDEIKNFAIESESIASEKLNFRIVWDEIWERKCDCYWDEKVQRTWNLGEKMRLTETVGLNPYWNSYWIGWLESVWDWDEKVQRKWDLREKGLRPVLPS
jgi:hypothetical protein